MAHHAMAVEARRAWGRAWRQTQKSITDGWADWSIEDWDPGDRSPPGGVVWFCRSRGPSLQFTGYVRDAADAFFSVPPCRPSSSGARPWQTLGWRGCGAWRCLRVSHASAGATATAGGSSRGPVPTMMTCVASRSLHTGQRSACWVFKSSDRFVARLLDGVIQVSGATAREALCGLRQAVVQYRRTYGAGHASKPRQRKQIEAPRPAQAAAALRFRHFAARIGGRGSARFWAAGPIALGFRPTRSDPGGAERDELGGSDPPSSRFTGARVGRTYSPGVRGPLG